jgi:putative aldouronate transport system substrate-binding protein
MHRKVMLGVLLVLASAVFLDAAPALPPVNLKWYYIGSPQKDGQMVNDAVNKITVEKLNAKISLVAVDWGSYDDKMKVIIASGEDYDLCYTANWVNNYYSAVSKGAYLPLDGLLESYGKDIKAAIPAEFWEAARIKGKLYGILNYQTFTYRNGVIIPADLVSKYSLDVRKVKGLADLEPFLETVKNKEKALTPFLNICDNLTGAGFELDSISDQASPLVIKATDKGYRVVNRYETDTIRSYFDLYRKWYLKGYFRKDSASLKDYQTEIKSGKYAAFYGYNCKPGFEGELLNQYGKDFVIIPTSDYFSSTGAIVATMTAISRTSKNPERAMMFYNLLYTDKSLYNLLCFGIEGTHYARVSGDTIEVAPNSGYFPNTSWLFGNQFNALYLKGQRPGLWDETARVNTAATASSLLGFNYDPEPKKALSAQVNAITAEYVPILNTGTIETRKGLAELNGKLKKAGLDELIADAQSQIDQWRKENNR